MEPRLDGSVHEWSHLCTCQEGHIRMQIIDGTTALFMAAQNGHLNVLVN